MYDNIINYFPPEEEEKANFIPLLFSSGLGLMFLYFVSNLIGAGANLSNLTFWGVLFTLNYLSIFGIIVAFWV